MEKVEKIERISNVEDVVNVSGKIVGNLVKGSLTYFNIVVVDSSGFSQCFFTPTSEVHEGRGKKHNMIFVGDYDKILMMLLSHPKVHDIEYNAEENMVSAIFDNPLQDEYDQHYTSELEEY